MMRDSTANVSTTSGQAGNIQQYPESVLQHQPGLLQLSPIDVSDWYQRHYGANQLKYNNINR